MNQQMASLMQDSEMIQLYQDGVLEEIQKDGFQVQKYNVLKNGVSLVMYDQILI